MIEFIEDKKAFKINEKFKLKTLEINEDRTNLKVMIILVKIQKKRGVKMFMLRLILLENEI